MILVVLPNPSLDKTVVIPHFALGAIYRVFDVLTLAGGKGFNFARALRTLGEESLVVTLLRGHSGQYLRELAEQEGLACDGLPVATELRTCLTIIDTAAHNRQTEIYEKGVPLPEKAWHQLNERAARHFTEAGYLAVCGSYPPGMPEGWLRDLLIRAHDAKLPVALDTYGPQLTSALELHPQLLKINQYEAGQMVNRKLSTPAHALEAARQLQQQGARQVVITLGKVGTVGLTAEGHSFGWRPPEVAALCTTGSGDSFFAGVMAGLLRGLNLPQAARLGVAAGAANTLHIGAGRFAGEEVERLLPLVQPLDV